MSNTLFIVMIFYALKLMKVCKLCSDKSNLHQINLEMWLSEFKSIKIVELCKLFHTYVRKWL